MFTDKFDYTDLTSPYTHYNFGGGGDFKQILNYISIAIKLVFPMVSRLKNIKRMLVQMPFLTRMCIITCELTKCCLNNV